MPARPEGRIGRKGAMSVELVTCHTHTVYSGHGEGSVEEVAAAAARFAALLGRQAAKQPDIPLRVLGPTPASIWMINETYRYKLTVKCRNDKRFRALLREVLALYEEEKLPARAAVAVDLHADGDI